MNQDDKRKYMREWYRKNAERLRAESRAKYSLKKGKAKEMPKEVSECCDTCKRFSAPEKKCSSGWCMKLRKVRRKKDICPEYIPNVKLRYEQPVHQILIFSGE